MTSIEISRAGRRGSAYILAIAMLVVFTAMGAAFATFASLGTRSSKNVADIQRAQLMAESGMNFAVWHIRRLALPHDTNDQTAIANTAAALNERLGATIDLAGEAVTCSTNAVSVPRIQTEDGAFEMYVVQQMDGKLTLEVHGLAGNVRRVVAMDLIATTDPPTSAFSYGVASRGPITIGGEAQIRGKNGFTEASVISATEGPVAVKVTNDAVVEGDISSVGRATSVVLSGSPTIAGSRDPVVIREHIHFGVAPPVFPEVNTSIFRPLATNIVDNNTDTSVQGKVFENILIKAGSNTTFAGDVVINGVVFIEAPNIVSFSGTVTLNGLVATEQTDEAIQNCKLTFQGEVQAFGVDSLPDEPQFTALKELTGTFIVAPGFDVDFAGAFSTINGTVAADKLSFSGLAVGTVRGSVIGLSDHPTSVEGSVNIIIDRSGEDAGDAGFLMPMTLDADARTYREDVSTYHEPL